MTSAISSVQQQQAAAAAAAAASSAGSSNSSGGATGTQTLGQDAFLKLLMAQLSNQDPLNPTDGTEFVTQLAQFSLVEQSQSQSTTLGQIQTQLQGLTNSDATALVGKSVTMSGNTMAFDGTDPCNSAATLGGAASSVTVQISDSSGNVVRTMQLGAQPSGTLNFTWNGLEDNGQTAPAGNYTVAVNATASGGATIPVQQTVTGTVTSVSFSQGYPTVTLNNGTTAPVSELSTVGAPQSTNAQQGSQ